MKKSYIIFLTVALAIIIGCLVYSSYANKKIDESINAPIGGDIFNTMPAGNGIEGWNDTPEMIVEGQNDNPNSILPMKLTDKTWTWVKTTYANGTVETPKSPEKFKLTFTNPNRFSSSTDCNGVGGEYMTSGGNGIKFDKMMSTLMYCEGSQEGIYSQALTKAESYSFSGNGELVFQLTGKSGAMTFK